MANSVREQLASVLGTEAFDVRRRDRRWLALTSDRVAFAADDDAGWQRLLAEHWLIDRWRATGDRHIQPRRGAEAS